MLNDVVKLVSYTVTQDAIGQDILTEKTTEVFAKKNGVPRGEFFAAGQKGLRPAAMFEVYTDEYGSETDLQYDSKTYSIYRAYDRDDYITELYCEVRTGG